jgi:hypothetical protein
MNKHVIPAVGRLNKAGMSQLPRRASACGVAWRLEKAKTGI